MSRNPAWMVRYQRRFTLLSAWSFGIHQPIIVQEAQSVKKWILTLDNECGRGLCQSLVQIRGPAAARSTVCLPDHDPRAAMRLTVRRITRL